MDTLISDDLSHRLTDTQIKAIQKKIIMGLDFPTPKKMSLSIGINSASLNSGSWVLWFPKEWLVPVEKHRNPKWEREFDLLCEEAKKNEI